MLHDPLAGLGSDDPELDASVLAHAVLGTMTDHLWAGTRATTAEIDHVVRLCLRAVVTRSEPRRSDD